MALLFALWVLGCDLAARVAMTEAGHCLAGVVFVALPALAWLHRWVRVRAPQLPTATALMAPLLTALPASWVNQVIAGPPEASRCSGEGCWRSMVGSLVPSYIGWDGPIFSLLAAVVGLGAWFLLATPLLRELARARARPPHIPWVAAVAAMAAASALFALANHIASPSSTTWVASLPLLARLEPAPGSGEPTRATLVPRSTAQRPMLEYWSPEGDTQGSFALVSGEDTVVRGRLFVRDAEPLEAREDTVAGVLYLVSGGQAFAVRASDLKSRFVLLRGLVHRVGPHPGIPAVGFLGLATAAMLQRARRRAEARLRCTAADARASVYRQPAEPRSLEAPTTWLATFDAWSIAALLATMPPILTQWLGVTGP